MNPRHRRLLIPGLLVALLVVVVVASLAGRSDASEVTTPSSEQVSTIDDPRITEASGMAISLAHEDLAYVVNDSGNDPEVLAVRISTGEVVGTTTVTGAPWRDTEALAIDGRGRLWVADTGDNLVQRRDAALYAFDEQGPGDHTVTAETYPVRYEDGAEDAEALLLDPLTGAKYLVSKGLVVGDVYALPADLSRTEPNVATRVERISGIVTDGSFTPDGSRVLLRTYGDVRVLDPADWSIEQQLQVPVVNQGETLAVEGSGESFLIGSEGEGSPLIRVALPATPTDTSTLEPTPTPTRVVSDGSAAPSGNGFAGATWGIVALVVLALLGVSAWISRGR